MLTQLFGKDRCVALKYDRGAGKPARPRFEWLPALAVSGIRVSVRVVRIPLLIAYPSEDSWGGYVGSHMVNAQVSVGHEEAPKHMSCNVGEYFFP